MKTATLMRDTYWQTGTYGILYVEGRQFPSVEQPWNDNTPFESCIPEGTYTVSPRMSPRFGDCFILSGGTVVKEEREAKDGQRYLCLIHSANWADQLQGCIAFGSRRDFMPTTIRKGVKALGVTDSARTLRVLLDLLGDKEWELRIVQCEGAKAPKAPMRITSLRDRLAWPFGDSE